MSSANSENLLTLLHRWATQQDENFITEAFAHLLRRLLRTDAALGISFLNWLTEGRIEYALEHAAAISVSTQVTTSQGRPDLEIRTVDSICYVEAKVESGLGELQLHRYLAELDASTLDTKILVFLTRYGEDIDENIRDRVVCRRWYQVSDLLQSMLDEKAIGDPITQHLVSQFREFLHGRGMTMDQVGWELPNGINALRSLTDMLGEAINTLSFSYKRTAGWEWIGFYLTESSATGTTLRPYFIGIYFRDPNILRFETFETAVHSDAVERAGCGELKKEATSIGGMQWGQDLILDSEEVHFFARSRASQMQCIEHFLRQSHTAGSKARLPS